MNEGVQIAIASGLVAILTALITNFATRRKILAEVKSTEVTSEVSIAKVAMDFIEVQRQAVEEQRKEALEHRRHREACEKELATQKKKLEDLRMRLEALERHTRPRKDEIRGIEPDG